MSETSSVTDMRAPESITRPTSVDGGDTESIISTAPQIPGAPPPTRAHTVAGADVPDNEYIQARLANISLTTPPAPVGVGIESAKDESVTSEESESFMEANNWSEIAEEDLMNALKRIATTAEDEHKADPGKSVEEYYSIRVAKLIKEGPIEFDTKFL